MLDVKWIQSNAALFDQMMIKRQTPPQAKRILELDKERRSLLQAEQDLQQNKNQQSKKGAEFKHDKASLAKLKEEGLIIDEQLAAIQSKLSEITQQLEEILVVLPNILAEDIPNEEVAGEDTLIKEWAPHKKHAKLSFAPLAHYELGERLRMMDFERTAKMSGSRFVTLSRGLARLERALVNFMLETHINQFGFIEVSPPYMVRDKAMYNSGQLPKFHDESFLTTNEYRLIPTAEVSLVNMVTDSILTEETLPLRMVAYTPCFRSEVSSGGRDTRGMIRMHQFSKVELVSITTPEQSKQEHDFLVHAAETILQQLCLPYKVVLLCPSNMGIAAQKTYDIEVWMPGSNTYREIASCSNCGDYQARRMKSRYRKISDNKPTLVHTLNASGLPIGRTLAAILENFQHADGSIEIPQILVPYMGGATKINPLSPDLYL